MSVESNTMTLSEAIAQGYKLCGYADRGYQSLVHIDDLTDEDVENAIEDGEPYVLFTKEPSYVPSISAETIAEMVTEHIESEYAFNTGDDDTTKVEYVMKEVDFEAVTSAINQAVSALKSYTSTDITLIT
jgi:hypothetical protein